jgi:hypothetical protein
MACQARPTARHPESQDAHIANGRQDHDGGDEEEHEKWGAVENTPRAVECLHAAQDIDDREYHGDGQRGHIDRSGPSRHGPDGGQRRDHKVGRHQAAEHIRVGRTSFSKPQDRGAGAQGEHGTGEQQPAAAVDGPALPRQQGCGTENNGKPSGSNVDG